MDIGQYLCIMSGNMLHRSKLFLIERDRAGVGKDSCQDCSSVFCMERTKKYSSAINLILNEISHLNNEHDDRMPMTLN